MRRAAKFSVRLGDLGPNGHRVAGVDHPLLERSQLADPARGKGDPSGGLTPGMRRGKKGGVEHMYTTSKGPVFWVLQRETKGKARETKGKPKGAKEKKPLSTLFFFGGGLASKGNERETQRASAGF